MEEYRDTPRPTMTDEEMVKDYPRLAREYALLHQDYREAIRKPLKIPDVSDIVHRAELKVLEDVSDYIPCEIYSQAVIFSQKKRDNVR